ncbi:S26 family signal peptidase [Candidatus Solirubrobacter pratensis]|uniref:S26 family signal peptidase n=1 Tax=Candidatus Solirubrobacter pratensis TaxID=1298857 RepID=UPI00048002D4|nr:S26 family signal peptidase [Candidatus Solirubrobacter pratensis]
MQPTPLLAASVLAPARMRVAAPPRSAARAQSSRIRWGWMLVAAVLAAAAGGVAYLREWPPLATVMSASMSPTIDTGDMAVLKRLDRPARVGDVVVVHVPDDARTRYGYPTVVIHRVVRIAPGGAVTTKGDARREPDPFSVPRSALSARVVGRLPAGGSVLAFLGSPLGLLWLGGGAALFIGMPLLDRRRHRAEREADGLRGRLEQISEELVELRFERLAERDALSQQLQLVTAAFNEHLERLPGQIQLAVAAAVGAAAPAEPEPEPEAEGHPLEQLALALVPASAGAAADESRPQLAFLLDVERPPRFARQCEGQLELGLDGPPHPSAQLSLVAAAPRPAPPPPPPPPPPTRPGTPVPSVPTWDASQLSVRRERRRSGGLVGLAIGLVASHGHAGESPLRSRTPCGSRNGVHP